MTISSPVKTVLETAEIDSKVMASLDVAFAGISLNSAIKIGITKNK
jgi:hypothetical protein